MGFREVLGLQVWGVERGQVGGFEEGCKGVFGGGGCQWEGGGGWEEDVGFGVGGESLEGYSVGVWWIRVVFGV